jgi:argininosuccinate lyase
VLGRPIEISPEVVARAVNPAQAAQARRGTGGPSPSDMDQMLAALEERRRRDTNALESRHRRIVEAQDRLDADFRNLAEAA